MTSFCIINCCLPDQHWLCRNNCKYSLTNSSPTSMILLSRHWSTTVGMENSRVTLSLAVAPFFSTYRFKVTRKYGGQCLFTPELWSLFFAADFTLGEGARFRLWVGGREVLLATCAPSKVSTVCVCNKPQESEKWDCSLWVPARFIVWSWLEIDSVW